MSSDPRKELILSNLVSDEHNIDPIPGADFRLSYGTKGSAVGLDNNSKPGLGAAGGTELRFMDVLPFFHLPMH